MSEARRSIVSTKSTARMSVFEQALAQFPDDDQRKIREVLSRWSRETSLGARVDVNLRLERFLPAVPDMQKLLAVFLGHSHTDWKAFERAYEAACRQKSLRGGEVTLAPLPQVLGRAIDRGAWENHLFQNHRQLFANDRRRITRFIDTLLSMPRPPGVCRGGGNDVPLRRLGDLESQ